MPANSEEVLSRLTTPGGQLVLTSHRVVYGWRTKFTSIRLADVSSAGVTRLASWRMTFFIGSCVGIAACLMPMIMLGPGPVVTQHQSASVLLFTGAFLLATFAIQQFHFVQISSSGATIRFRIPSVQQKQVTQLLRKLDGARVHWRSADARGVASQVDRVAIQGSAVPKAAAEKPAPQAATAPGNGIASRAPVQPRFSIVVRQWAARHMHLLQLGRGDRASRPLGKSAREWLTEAVTGVAVYTPVALVAVAIAWTGVRLIVSMWQSSLSR